MFRQAASRRRHNPLRTIGLVAIPALLLVKILLPSPEGVSAFQAGPSVIVVPGVVRDFSIRHPDFHVLSAAGYGHIAGTIAESLGGDFRPVFEGDGFRVAAQWRDRNSEPIAPHLADGLVPIQLGSAPLAQDGTVIDSWDPEAGDYGVDGNVGPAPDILVGVPMPTITPPEDLGPSVGNVTYNPGVVTIDQSFRCNSFTIKQDSVVRISGDVIVRIDGSFSMQQISRLELLDGATLRLYVGGAVQTGQTAMININTLDPSRMFIYMYGTSSINISQYSQVCATIVAPRCNMELGQDVQFFGTFYGAVLDMRQGSQFHSPGKRVFDSCGGLIEDRLGVFGAYTPGLITSRATFDQWYNDVLGVNLSQISVIRLIRDGLGVYECDLPEFHPIDDRLFGNEGQTHNNYFTYAFTASFTYEACTGQFFQFTGNDDAWMFIDGDLVLDIGGVRPGTRQHIELDRLKLVDGQVYGLHFFYAQRNPQRSSFNLRTNVPIVPPAYNSAGSASFD